MLYPANRGLTPIELIYPSSSLQFFQQNEKQQSITYNHYYTNNVQKARQQSTRNFDQKVMNEASADDWNGKPHISNNAVDAEKLLAS